MSPGLLLLGGAAALLFLSRRQAPPAASSPAASFVNHYGAAQMVNGVTIPPMPPGPQAVTAAVLSALGSSSSYTPKIGDVLSSPPAGFVAGAGGCYYWSHDKNWRWCPTERVVQHYQRVNLGGMVGSQYVWVGQAGSASLEETAGLLRNIANASGGSYTAP